MQKAKQAMGEHIWKVCMDPESLLVHIYKISAGSSYQLDVSGGRTGMEAGVSNTCRKSDKQLVQPLAHCKGHIPMHKDASMCCLQVCATTSTLPLNQAL